MKAERQQEIDASDLLVTDAVDCWKRFKRRNVAGNWMANRPCGASCRWWSSAWLCLDCSIKVFHHGVPSCWFPLALFGIGLRSAHFFVGVDIQFNLVFIGWNFYDFSTADSPVIWNMQMSPVNLHIQIHCFSSGVGGIFIFKRIGLDNVWFQRPLSIDWLQMSVFRTNWQRLDSNGADAFRHILVIRW